MTDAQWKVKTKQITDEVNYELREFRKGCVTQGIVKIVRDGDMGFYELQYRGVFVFYLYGDSEDSSKLRVVWNTIRIAEQLLKAVKE